MLFNIYCPKLHPSVVNQSFWGVSCGFSEPDPGWETYPAPQTRGGRKAQQRSAPSGAEGGCRRIKIGSVLSQEDSKGSNVANQSLINHWSVANQSLITTVYERVPLHIYIFISVLLLSTYFHFKDIFVLSLFLNCFEENEFSPIYLIDFIPF